MGLIELKNVFKIYNKGKANEVLALRGVNLTVKDNTLVCLKGPSGSGKSTLLSIIGCVLSPTSGSASIAGQQLSRLPDRFLTIHRRKTIGFIFQQFNVLPQLTVLENIGLPLLPLGVSPRLRKERSLELMEKLSIAHRANFPAGQISGGELQRVAIARALINSPPIVLADEPTAHLDSKLSKDFMTIVQDLLELGKTVILTSHDPLITEHPSIEQVIEVRDGQVYVS